MHGSVRLTIELVVSLGAAALMALVWRVVPGLILGALVVIHYATTTARTR